MGPQKQIIDNYHINPEATLSSALGQKIDGVIGNDLLYHYSVKIDFKNKILSFFDSEEFATYPEGDEVAIEVNSLVSSVPLTISFPGGLIVEGEFKTLADVQAAAASLAESVRIGNFECADMKIYISTSKKGLFAVTKYAGILGNKFFQNFNVIFDYKRKKLHLEKY